jgi:hypothetical protein
MGRLPYLRRLQRLVAPAAHEGDRQHLSPAGVAPDEQRVSVRCCPHRRAAAPAGSYRAANQPAIAAAIAARSDLSAWSAETSTTTRCGPEGASRTGRAFPGRRVSEHEPRRARRAGLLRSARSAETQGTARRARRSLRRCGTRRAPPRSGRRRGVEARRAGRPPVAPRRRSTPHRAEAPAAVSGARRCGRAARPARPSLQRRERFLLRLRDQAPRPRRPHRGRARAPSAQAWRDAGGPEPDRPESQPGT